MLISFSASRLTGRPCCALVHDRVWIARRGDPLSRRMTGSPNPRARGVLESPLTEESPSETAMFGRAEHPDPEGS
jgi:hypothetical protein